MAAGGISNIAASAAIMTWRKQRQASISGGSNGAHRGISIGVISAKKAWRRRKRNDSGINNTGENAKRKQAAKAWHEEKQIYQKREEA